MTHSLSATQTDPSRDNKCESKEMAAVSREEEKGIESPWSIIGPDVCSV